MTWTCVPVQRSAVVQLVPRTVAAAYLPRVLNLPLALLLSSCSVLLRAAVAVTSAALPLHLANDGPPFTAPSTSVSVVRPLCAWLILKIAPLNRPFWVLTLPLCF